MSPGVRGAAAPLLACALLSGCGAGGPLPARVEVPRPEQRVEAEHGAVAASHPLAAAAGVEALRDGGSAADAAVATAFVLGVVEPMMAGLGGGGSATVWMQGARRADHVEFYASAGADPDHGLEAVPDSLLAPERRTGIPGTVAGLWALHRRYGALPWERLLAPAVGLAREGFPVHPLLARVVAEEREKLARDTGAAARFLPGGEPVRAGRLLRRPELARTLERIAAGGRDGFYRGETARRLADRLSAGDNPVTAEDLARFGAKWKAPLCGTFRGYTVLTAPPPLAGVEILETLNLLEPQPLKREGLPVASAAALGRLVDAVRVARADRYAFIGDPRDAAVPAVGIASPAYAAERSPWMGRDPVPDSVEADDPWDEDAPGSVPAACAALHHFPPSPLRPRPPDRGAGTPRPPDPDAAGDEGEAHTTHLSVVDAAGNAVSLTFTMGLYFGTGLAVDGYFLNTAAGNFGQIEANRRGPYRTPRSSTAPTLVLRDGRVVLVVGSPGSGRIPPAVVHAILYTLVHGRDPWTAVATPRAYPFYGSAAVQVEGGFPGEVLRPLAARGYRFEARPAHDTYFGGLHVLLVQEDGTRVGAADPRRGGAALGY